MPTIASGAAPDAGPAQARPHRLDGVGSLVMHLCADHVRKASLELDGNAAFIVFDDLELEIAPA